MASIHDRLARERSGGICEYCHLPQEWHAQTFEVDHILSRQHGGEDVPENVALACFQCNRQKGPNIAGIDPDTHRVTRLYHPRKDRWEAHFRLESALIVGTTAVGRTTARLLLFNHADYVELREFLLALNVFPGPH
jgi:hypothetical protein